ncbi:glucose dehydrogenase [FAD, quinone] [Halyomorpha halys]|uniref:glucose dehydrogenase [FAD, quinone] n=1 Tax=Halyomorpha halys TaxID=286706 RepID=UPI0006D4E6C4|nr:glucose dehydrogenase [FAD, quinone] [Halyomorpha halys]XP_014281430.1 glucose dehydrogenase [FAD, quinone] [Halyomorpha halys]
MKEYSVFLLCLLLTKGKGTILDEINRLYLQQGIPFRENIFLDNLPIVPEYDFIIVGSGPAGSAIANRLSEIPRWKILLLEAGLEGNIYNDIPLVNEYTLLGNFSINYDVEKEDNACLGLVDKVCHWPSGNGIGGATLVNGMIYTRGHPSDFDSWGLEGNPGWSYQEVLPYFLKLENMSIPKLAASKYHSTTGPVHIQYPFQTRLGKMFLEAGKELGYDTVDYNNPNTMIGLSPTQTTIRGVRRESAASAYLLPVKTRPNLHIVKNAYVTNLLIDSNSKKVYGLKFIKNSKKRKVRAKNEIILSAGTFGSPKILMLSGIGPADHLKKIGIPVVADLPVGYNLQEHLGTAVSFLINTTDSITIPKLLRGAPNSFVQWFRGEKGIFSCNIAEALGYVRTKYAKDDKPDIELIFLATTPAGDGGAFWPKTRNISMDVYEKTWKPIYFKEGFTIAQMMMYPRSRGNVKLRSKNPLDPIVIDSNFLSHPDDVAILREGARIATKFGKTKIFQSIGAKLYSQPIYGCEQHEFGSDEYWECGIRSITIQWHHQCGTCRMGVNPEWSVVDSRLKVHGLTGLRVADASIMPTIPGTHTMAPSYMIGEKAADIIKEDWGVLK